MVLITNIPEAIDNGTTDSELNIVIDQYLVDWNIDKTISEWCIENYAQLRRWAYPPIRELNDAQVKLNSGIAELESEGQSQFDDYVQKCLNVKTRFPKENNL